MGLILFFNELAKILWGPQALFLRVPEWLDHTVEIIPGMPYPAFRLSIIVIGAVVALLLSAALGPGLLGQVFDGLQVPDAVYQQVPADVRLLSEPDLGRLAAPRRRGSHKGDFGHVLVVGGSEGKSGAAILAARAAARSGAGLVTVATRPEHAALSAATRPELMCHGVEKPQQLDPLLHRASVVAIGPGLGQGRWGRSLLGRILQTKLPLVVDADALNLLAAEPTERDDWILTPHPGEAARLLAGTTGQIQADRFLAVARLQQRFGGVAVLKGSGTLIQGRASRPPAVCSQGNPGMASGGMGDVLTGVIGGLVAQGFEPEEAACIGVCLHAAAADRAAEAGERGLLAADLMPAIRCLVNPGQARC